MTSEVLFVRSQYQQKRAFILQFRSRTETLHKNEPQLSEYMPHRHDKYIYILYLYLVI